MLCHPKKSCSEKGLAACPNNIPHPTPRDSPSPLSSKLILHLRRTSFIKLKVFHKPTAPLEQPPSRRAAMFTKKKPPQPLSPRPIRATSFVKKPNPLPSPLPLGPPAWNPATSQPSVAPSGPCCTKAKTV